MLVPTRVALILILLTSGACDRVPADHAKNTTGTVESTSTGNSSTWNETAILSEWVFDGYSPLLEVPEPSGLCYHPERGTLFIVDDGDIGRPAGLYELNYQAEVLASTELGFDLEGVCYCPADGMLYVCDEMDERVYVVDPDSLETACTFQVSRYFGGEELLIEGGDGFEGIEYMPGSGEHEQEAGYLLLLNQNDPHCLVRVALQDIDHGASDIVVPIRAYWELAKVNAGELHYSQVARELWVVCSWMNVLMVLDPVTMEVLRWEVFPGCAQEAVTQDSIGRLWIGYDMGGIARYIWREEE